MRFAALLVSFVASILSILARPSMTTIPVSIGVAAMFLLVFFVASSFAIALVGAGAATAATSAVSVVFALSFAFFVMTTMAFMATARVIAGARTGTRRSPAARNVVDVVTIAFGGVVVVGLDHLPLTLAFHYRASIPFAFVFFVLETFAVVVAVFAVSHGREHGTTWIAASAATGDGKTLASGARRRALDSLRCRRNLWILVVNPDSTKDPSTIDHRYLFVTFPS